MMMSQLMMFFKLKN